jgi:hypothetical protein
MINAAINIITTKISVELLFSSISLSLLHKYLLM